MGGILHPPSRTEIYRKGRLRIYRHQDKRFSLEFHGRKKLTKFFFGYLDIFLYPTLVLFALFLSISYFLPSESASISTNLDPSVEEVNIEDSIAKKGDEKYLEESEKKKQEILKRKKKEIKVPLQIKSYRVKEKDSLEDIATKLDVNLAHLSYANNIHPEDTVYPGTVLYFANTKGLLYRVKRGDTLSSIANSYSVSLATVEETNSIPPEKLLSVGDRILLPGINLVEPKPRWFVPVSSRIITSGYGWRTYPQSKFHEAIDLKANYENVYATRRGKVEFAGWLGGYGKTVVVNHEGDYKSLYAHNSKLFVSEGDVVRGGSLIAKSGCTGYCFGPHLHFEITYGEKTLNPAKILKGLRSE